MKNVIVRQETVTIPTYAISEYDKNPMFLEKRVYQGSSGRVYPHPVCEGVSDTKTGRSYHAIYLENDYLLVMILPELGGRIQRLYDKTNGYDAVYYNEVVKPALVGLAGPWISGGIEFNWPQHHRPSTFDPVDWKIEHSADGSVTVWVGETEKMFHTKGEAGFTLRPDCAYLEIHGRVYNPTDRPQTFLWWANPAGPINDNTQSIFPPDVHAVMDHGKRAVSKFPIADGIYYKYDYAPGTDISRYKNIPVPTSYMAYHSDYDFIGNYDYGRKAGLLHIADHHVSPGKKQWTWGNGDFGRAWDRNLTDENGPYIELMTGVFTDNQPDFTFLKPGEEKTFTQYFMPYKEAGALKNASTRAALGIIENKDSLTVTVYAPAQLSDAVLEVESGGSCACRPLTLAPAESVTATLPVQDAQHYTVKITQNNREVLHYTPAHTEEPIPSPAEEIPAPEKLPSTERLFLAAVHLEQYRHATRSPADYYREGLRRDPDDLRLNNGYGKYLYNKGLFAESIPYFRTAIKTATWKNPNPYDCEPYYNLGLALRRQGEADAAFDAFYKAAWDGNMQGRAFYELACLSAAKGDFAAALDFAEKSLVRNLHDLKARTLKTALLRLLGQADAALRFADETRRIDPLDHGAVYERCRLTGQGWVELRRLLRDEPHNYIELALTYADAGLSADAVDILHRAPVADPMLHYYLFALTQDTTELNAAEAAPSLYCFPNRLEDMQALQYAVAHSGQMAAYYLGCLLYDKGRWQEAKTAWENCAEKINLPTVWRNLALVYYNNEKDGARARAAMERAFTMDESDARVFFELDQLDKTLNAPFAERLARMERHAALLEKRDDLYTEYITLLNLRGDFQKAYDCIMGHHFHPWEGGEDKIPAQYRYALMGLAQQTAPAEAVNLLTKALTYPHNLGEGKLIGNLDNDLYELLGEAYHALGREDDAKRAFTLAARGGFDLSGAMYYNDQPPQMMYYATKALAALGQTEEANRRFTAFVDYAAQHKNDTPEIDYFAVSLPDFLIFEGDLAKNNRVHCCLLEALGQLGLGHTDAARAAAAAGLAENCCQYELHMIAMK